MNTNSIPYLDQVLKYNDALLGLPALPLVFVVCLATGYAIKAMPFVSNRYIPLCVFLNGALSNLVLGLGGMTGTIWDKIADGSRQTMLGLIVACAAWFVHNKWLKKYETTGNTETFDKPKSNSP